MESISEKTIRLEAKLTEKLSAPWSHCLVGLVMCVALYLVFQVMPEEEVMGAVQKIFYFHVGSVMAAYLMMAVLLVASCCFLLSKEDTWQRLSESAASVGLLFFSIVLLTGMIWGHSAWNTWWRWEPRLTSSLLLWLLLLSYNLFAAFAEQSSLRKNLLSVLGILSAVMVPVVIFSIRLLKQTEQLHPQVIARSGLGHPLYKWGLSAAIVGCCLFAVLLLVERMKLAILEEKILKIDLNLQNLNWERENA